MKTRLLTHICFLLPFCMNTFNVQVFAAYLISSALAQIIAYVNLSLLIIGITLTIKYQGEFSKTAKLWIIYFIIYFNFATLAGVIHENPSQILVSIIPFIYVLAFYFYMSNPKNHFLFGKVALISFVGSTIFAIYLYNINFDLERGGIYKYRIERSQGVFGDANNTALIAIIAFVFLFKLYKPKKRILIFIKIVLLGLVFYSLVLTFSTTGFLVFIISLIMLNYKFFTPKRTLITIILLPLFYFTLINLNTLTANLNLIGQQRDKVNNIVNVLTFNTDEIDDSGRSYLVMKLINDYVFENPIMGNGIDFGMSQRAHNTLVSVWADAGIFALIFFLFMLWKYLIKTIYSPPDIRYFILPLLLALYIFMLSLQSIINKPCLMVLFVYLAYIVDFNKIITLDPEK